MCRGRARHEPNPVLSDRRIRAALAAPPFFTGIMAALRESEALLPQLFIAGFIRQLALRKWVCVAGPAVQALAVAGLAAVAATLRGTAAALWGLACLALAALLGSGLGRKLPAVT